MGVFENISIPGHEIVNFFQDESVGLKSISSYCRDLRDWNMYYEILQVQVPVKSS